MSIPTYTIKPLYYGRFPTYEKSICIMMTGFGVKTDNPSIGYLIQGNGKNYLVDTGPGVQDIMTAKHPLINCDFPVETNVVKVLEKEGLKPEDIDAVIWTHLHWDHCYNSEYFPGVPFYVQEAEVTYALSPLQMHGNVYEAPCEGMTPDWLKAVDRLKIVRGDYHLDDGIELILTPGHTPGGQCIIVNTTDGEYLVAGDTIMQYENWNGNGKLKHIYSTAHVNLWDFEASYQRIEKLNPAYILPGHDYKVFEHKVYPYEKE